MTIDEYIEHFNLVVAYAKRGKEYATNFSDLDNLIYFNAGVLGFLKELKELRKRYNIEVEMCKVGIDLLGVYKKALELASEDIMKKELRGFCAFKCDKCKYYPNDCVFHTKANIEYYLQKASGK